MMTKPYLLLSTTNNLSFPMKIKRSGRLPAPKRAPFSFARSFLSRRKTSLRDFASADVSLARQASARVVLRRRFSVTTLRCLFSPQ